MVCDFSFLECVSIAQKCRLLLSFMQRSLLPSSANSDQYSDSCEEDEDSDHSSEKEEQEDPSDYCKGWGGDYTTINIRFCMVNSQLLHSSILFARIMLFTCEGLVPNSLP